MTVWFDEEAIANWKADKTGEPGGQRVYSDMAIETGLVVRMVYKLAYRQTEGFLHSIASLLGLGIEIPDYSTLSRRSRLLRKKLRIPKAASTQPIHLMIDSTGLRIHVGNARKPPKQRAWRKLHIAVDRETGNIVASELTASRARDATRVPALLTQIQAPLVSVAADSAYDKEAVYEAIEAHSPGRRTRVVIPPQRNATLSQNSNTAMQERDRHIRAIERHGRREWYKLSGYTKRSMVENAVYRYKAIIGPEMRARTLAKQRVEHRIGCEILNKRCLRCLLLVMCTYPFAKKALTLYLARSEGHERYFGCNLMQCKVLASSHQHLMAEAPKVQSNEELPGTQFTARSSPRSRFEPAVRTPGGPVARHPQPRGRKPALRREIPSILRGFQGRLSC